MIFYDMQMSGIIQLLSASDS